MEFLSLSRRRSSARNVPSGEERGETDVFAGYLFACDSKSQVPSCKQRCIPPIMNVFSGFIPFTFDLSVL